MDVVRPDPRLRIMDPDLTPSPDQSHPFQVDLRAVVELLSTNIYSHPSVFVRELIQNGRDAIAARVDAARVGETDPFSEEDGLITITPSGTDSPELTVHDNGAGMQHEEMAQLLATVGRSSKRDLLEAPRRDRLGQFGIGLLSCFMVSDEIVVETRPARGGSASRWVGRTDGTFTISRLSDSEGDQLPVGTTVRLSPREDRRDLTQYRQVWELAVRFAEFLPVRVRVDGPRGTESQVNRDAMFDRGIAGGLSAAGPAGDPVMAFTETDELNRLMQYGTELLGVQPLAVIPLEIEEAGTRGTAFVLPFAPSPGARQATRAYLGGILVGDSVPDLLPEWAFFTRVVLNSTGLTPTASREGFIQNAAFAAVKRGIADQLRAWVVDLAQNNRLGLTAFLEVHDLPLRSLAQHDEELARIILPHLTFETSAGRMLLSDLVRISPQVRYAGSIQEFRQMAGVLSPSEPVINAGYVYDEQLMPMIERVFPHVTAQRLDVRDVIAQLAEVIGPEAEQARHLERAAQEALTDLDCTVQVRTFRPLEVNALYVVDPDILRSMELRRLEEETDGFWGDLMRGMSPPAESAEQIAAEDAATLVLNWASPLVRVLASSEDDVVVSRTIRMLYVQAMLVGQNPLRRADRAVLNESLSDMVALSTSVLRSDISAADFTDAPGDDDAPGPASGPTK